MQHLPQNPTWAPIVALSLGVMQHLRLVAIWHRHLVAAAAEERQSVSLDATLYTQRKPIATHGDGLSSYVIGRVCQRRGEAFVGFDRLVCNTFFYSVCYKRNTRCVTNVTCGVLQVLHRLCYKCYIGCTASVAKGVPQARACTPQVLARALTMVMAKRRRRASGTMLGKSAGSIKRHIFHQVVRRGIVNDASADYLQKGNRNQRQGLSA